MLGTGLSLPESVSELGQMNPGIYQLGRSHSKGPQTQQDTSDNDTTWLIGWVECFKVPGSAAGDFNYHPIFI